MANHLELIQELQQLDKVPSLERLRAAQKRRTQQLKRWAVYEKEMQHKKRKADKKGRGLNSLQRAEFKKHVSFTASVALLEASARNDPDEGKDIMSQLYKSQHFFLKEYQITFRCDIYFVVGAQHAAY